MKIKLLFTATFAFFVLNFSSLAQIKIDNNGNIGLGTASPAYKVDIFGQTRIITTTPIYGNSATVIFNSYYSEINIESDRNNVGYLGYYNRWNTIYTRYINCPNPIITSDERMKTNIRQINTPLQTIKRLRGVTFDYKPEEYFGNNYQSKSKFDESETKNRLGFVAQEVQQILPQVVVYDTAKKYYGINYVALIPILVEAIKEQQLIIENLQNEIKELRKSNSKLKSASISDGTTNTSSAPNASEHVLYQNVPNPFSQSTAIEYYLANDFQRATLNIYDMNGTQLKSIALHQKGYGNVTLNGYELKAGMYMYALIVDGQLIDTKKMVLTE